MGVHEGRGQLAKALKELMSRWNETKGQWTDTQAEAFEQQYLQTIESDMKTAVSGMDHMAVVMSQIRRDCQ